MYSTRRSLLFVTLFSLFSFNPAVASDEDEKEYERHHDRGLIVVANRASASLSVIDVKTDTVIDTLTLPAAGQTPEPMYVVHVPQADWFLVGDRANNRVVAFDDEDFTVEGEVATGSGVFHMWADKGSHQLWVNNDIDKTATVIDPVSLQVIQTVAMPADLVDLGGKPHDVILDPRGDAAYVTLVGFAGASDYVVKFDTETFEEVARAEVGKDPHVSLTRRNKLLYVPSQNSNAVYVLKRADLSLHTIIEVPGAHGAGMPRHGRTFYTTNLPGGGSAGLFAINTHRNMVIGEGVDTPFPVPHNIALTRNGKKLYVTHSGATSDQVSVYRINRKTQLPEFTKTITVGTNPFGLTFVK